MDGEKGKEKEIFLKEDNLYLKDNAHKFSIQEQKLLILIAEILVKSIIEEGDGK